MNSLNFYKSKVSGFLTILLCCCIVLLYSTSTYAQQPGANLDQARNGTPLVPISPINWVNGNAGASNSHYIEGHAIPYRVVMSNLPLDGTVVTIELEYDATQGGKHAIEFIVQYQHLEPHLTEFGHSAEVVNPRLGFEAVTPAVANTWPIPAPPTLGSEIPGEPAATFNALPAAQRVMSLFGGTFSGATPIQYVTVESLALAQAKISFSVTFVPTSATAILAWAGHIATHATWGEGRTAVDINGSPYHTRLIDWNLTNLGNQDRSLNAEAVYDIPPCEFSGPGDLCTNSVGTYTVDFDSTSFSYLWSITQNGTNAFFVGGVNNTASVDVNSGTQAGSFTLSVTVSQTDNGVTFSTTCSTEVVVNPGPSCDISGLDEVCPGSTNVYSGPPGLSSYSWSISGDGTISGSTTSQDVTVDAGSTCPGSYTLSLTTSDGTGCESTCEFDVSVDDNEDPLISGVGDDAIILCPDVPVFSEPTASDNCTADPSLTFEDVTTPGDCPQEYSVTRTWTATDGCGNTSTASQTISVEDNSAPEISGVGDPFTVECPAVLVFSEPSASDNCDDDPLLTFEDVTTPGDCPQEYSVTRTWTATDACGNSSQASQTITVEDNTAPEITGVGGPETIECPATPQFSEPFASDLCDDNPLLTFEDVTTPGDCPQEYSVTRTWTATDACGNSSQASQTITVEDNTAPDITGVGGPETIECPATPQFSEPFASDLCDDNPLLTFEDVTTPGDCPQEYSVTRTWTATDACGNSSQASQTITVEDNTAPEITGVGGPETIECPATPLFSEPSASDLCDDNPLLTFEDVTTPGDCPQEYSVTRTWTATDACGNSSQASQTITVEDNTAPEITGVGGGPETIECPATPLFSEASASDLCDDNPLLTFEDVTTPGDCPQEYSVTRTWTATDACGNSSQASPDDHR